MKPEIEQTPLKQFQLSRIILPILFSLGVAAYLLYSENAYQKLIHLETKGAAWFVFALCFVCMMLRDAAYIWRMKLMGGEELSWRAAFDVTLLWEFSNTVMPSLTGGTPLMIYLLVKEKLNAGKSTAIIFLTIFFDQLFFTLTVPIVMLLMGKEAIFRTLIGTTGAGITVSFWGIYAVLAVYVALLGFGLIINPHLIKRFLLWIFSIKWLKKWQHIGEKTGDDLIFASTEFKDKGLSYWGKLLLGTAIAWISRFLVLNTLLVAFSPVSLSFTQHSLAFGRQSALFLLMFAAVTPGGSGIAEFLFSQLLSDMCPNPPGAAGMALLWRVVGFYPYMLLGAWLLPRWIHRVFK